MPISSQTNQQIIAKLQNTKHWVENDLPNMDLSNIDGFMHATVEICNHARLLLLTSVSLDSIHDGIPQEGFTKSQAPVVGLMVRIWKLYDQMTYHVSQNHGEVSSLFIRPIYEAYVKAMYIIRNPNSSDSFIKTSYKSDIEMYKDLKPKEEAGTLDPAGTRILRRIERYISEESMNLPELLQTNAQGWKFDGKDFRNLSKEILPDNFYSYVFSNASSFVHGDWRDIRRSHLTKQEDKYIPDPSTDNVSLHYILPTTIIVLKALIEYINWAQTDPDNFMLELIQKVEDGVRYIDQKYEEQRTD